MNIILTGSTGTLGSQVLIELLQQKNIAHIFLLVRERKGKTSLDRIKNILRIKSDTNSNLVIDLKKITVLNTADFFNVSYLDKNHTNHFIHSAGYVNLSIDAKDKDAIFEENLEFAKKIFQAFSPYISKFTYISTVFCIGDIGGLIANDYHNGTVPKFRNFYEESKFQSEQYLLKAGLQNNVSIQILRPSVLGGNIMESPQYFISKFMVYYLLGKFFYKSPLKDDIVRIITNFKTGLNIIPVDYVAKVIAKAIHKDIQQLNIAHSKCTNLTGGMTRIIEAVGATNFTFVDTANMNGDLADENEAEKFYYNSLGMHLNPYLISLPYEFDTELLESIVPIPEYDLEDYLSHTTSYAKNKNFRNERW